MVILGKISTFRFLVSKQIADTTLYYQLSFLSMNEIMHGNNSPLIMQFANQQLFNLHKRMCGENGKQYECFESYTTPILITNSTCFCFCWRNPFLNFSFLRLLCATVHTLNGDSPLTAHYSKLDIVLSELLITQICLAAFYIVIKIIGDIFVLNSFSTSLLFD